MEWQNNGVAGGRFWLRDLSGQNIILPRIILPLQIDRRRPRSGERSYGVRATVFVFRSLLQQDFFDHACRFDAG